jgi:hypothetical protein
VPPVDVEERGSEQQASEVAWIAQPVLKRRREHRDRTPMVVALVVGAVAIAVLKPWGLGAPAATSLEPPAATAPVAPILAPAAVPTAEPVIADPNAMTCLTHQVEQVLTLERWPDREIKSWSQPTGPMLTLSSSHVVGIGLCPGTGPVPSGASGPEASRDPLAWGPAVITDVKRIDGGRTDDLGVPRLLTHETDYVAAGVLYGPPPTAHVAPGASPRSEGSLAPLTTWRAGRYRIDYTFPGDPDHWDRTVVVEILTPLNNG